MDKKTHTTFSDQPMRSKTKLDCDLIVCIFPCLLMALFTSNCSEFSLVHCTQFTSFCFDWSVRVFIALVLVLRHSIEIDCDLPMSWVFLTHLFSFYSVPSAAYHYPLFLQDVTRQRIVTKRLHSGTVVMFNDVILINM